MEAVQRMTSAWRRFLFCDIDTGFTVVFNPAESDRPSAAPGHAAAR